jgi:hypothetical protein
MAVESPRSADWVRGALTALLTVAVLVMATVVVPGRARAADEESLLLRGEALAGYGDLIVSPSGQYELGHYGGSVVETMGVKREVVWGPMTAGSGGGAPVLVMQDDGNLVLYSTQNGSSLAVWQSGTAGHPGAFLAIQDDGNLVVYSAVGSALWQSATVSDHLNDPRGYSTMVASAELLPSWYLTARSGTYRLVMQDDGNLVLYGAAGPRWWSGTAGHPGAKFVSQTDGNHVVYAPSGQAIWQSGTARPGVWATLAVQDDGNLVAYALLGTAGQRVVWQSGTAA